MPYIKQVCRGQFRKSEHLEGCQTVIYFEIVGMIRLVCELRLHAQILTCYHKSIIPAQVLVFLSVIIYLFWGQKLIVNIYFPIHIDQLGSFFFFEVR
jgi:hypothetical protein